MDPLGLAFVGSDLFAVAEPHGSLLYCSFNDDPLVWRKVSSPPRRIELMAAVGTDLYLAGYEGKSKRLWHCRVDADRALEIKASTEVAYRGSNDLLGKLACGPWIALQETTTQFVEESYHISLFNPQTLTEEAHLVSVTVYSMFVYGDAGQPVPDAATWTRPVWVHDVLLIPSGPRGLGVLDLSGDSRTGGESFPEFCERRLHYQPMPAEVVRVVAVPHPQKFLAVMRTPDGLDTQLLDLPRCLR
jgi:hypothetical protein